MPIKRPTSKKIKNHTSITLLICSLGLSGSLPLLAQTKPLYENNFEKAEIGKLPEGFLALDGAFVVKQEEGNKVLELPGAPLDSFSVQFGPSESSDVAISARIKGTAKGRRYPTFGIGLSGVAGYRLQVSPAKKLLELYKDQDVKAAVPFEWKSGEWKQLRLQVRKAKAGEWKIEGKAWLPGTPEPGTWMISAGEKEEPTAGRASVFGSPFSGTPIQFDDLVLTTAESAE
ncbi:MAG: hypothetical protein QOJ40_1159 [Verrucomicrobiota bacterium]